MLLPPLSILGEARQNDNFISASSVGTTVDMNIDTDIESFCNTVSYESNICVLLFEF